MRGCVDPPRSCRIGADAVRKGPMGLVAGNYCPSRRLPRRSEARTTTPERAIGDVNDPRHEYRGSGVPDALDLRRGIRTHRRRRAAVVPVRRRLGIGSFGINACRAAMRATASWRSMSSPGRAASGDGRGGLAHADMRWVVDRSDGSTAGQRSRPGRVVARGLQRRLSRVRSQSCPFLSSVSAIRARTTSSMTPSR
jgi:hypothetical protein